MVLIVYGDEMTHLQNRQTCCPLSSFLKNDHTSLALSFLTSLTWCCSWCCEWKGLCLPAHGVLQVWVITPAALGVCWVGHVHACGARWLGVTFIWVVSRLGASIVGQLCRFPLSPWSSEWDGLGEANVLAPTDGGAWQIKMYVCSYRLRGSCQKWVVIVNVHMACRPQKGLVCNGHEFLISLL